MGQTCSFIKLDGARCEALPVKGSDLCFSHNPQTREAKKLAAVKGGKTPKKNYNPLPAVEVKTSKDVTVLLATVINEVRQGVIDLRVANCLGYLAGHLVKAIEVSDLEERMVKIEQAIESRNFDTK